MLRCLEDQKKKHVSENQTGLGESWLQSLCVCWVSLSSFLNLSDPLHSRFQSRALIDLYLQGFFFFLEDFSLLIMETFKCMKKNGKTRIMNSHEPIM